VLTLAIFLFPLAIFKGNWSSSRFNRRTAGADISSYKHWQISPVAFGKQKVQQKLSSYYTYNISGYFKNRNEQHIQPI
jgi:hypothetical protein